VKGQTGKGILAAVEGVSENRVTQVGEMNPDLVGSAGVEKDPEQGCTRVGA